MVNRIILILAIYAITLLSGCTTLKRFRSLTESGTNDTLADIDLFGFRLSQAKTWERGKSLWDLSADAQSQFVKILNSRFPDNDMFLNSLSFEYFKSPEEVSTDDYSNRDLRMIFSVSRKRNYSEKDPVSGIDITAADRIEYLKISLKLLDSCVMFTGWNMYSTEYGSIDIADISFSRTLDINASATLSAKQDNAGGAVSAGGNSSVSRKEDQAIKQRYLKLNGRLNRTKIEIEEEGTREIDLTGNIMADVSLGYNTFPETLTRIGGLKDSLGGFNTPDELFLEHSLVFIPAIEDIKDTIYAVLEMDFVYRNVVGGSKTFPEWDDRVKYYEGRVKKSIPLFTARDYVPDFYCIGSVNEDKTRDLIKVKTSAGIIYELKFKTYSEAAAFYAWLMDFLVKNESPGKILKIEGQTVEFRGNDLTYRQIIDDKGFSVKSYYY